MLYMNNRDERPHMSVMRDEIFEQPDVIARLASRPEAYRAAAGEAGGGPPGARGRASGARFVLYAARGTSDNAAVYGKYLATIVAGLPAGLAVPSAATVYDAEIDFRQCLVIGISQSGVTPDVTEYVSQARERGAFTVAITNDEDSRLAGAADRVLATGAGIERAVAATKTYTSQLAALALFWAEWTGDETVRAQMGAAVPQAMTAALTLEARAIELAAHLRAVERLLVTSRGYNYATALETALKLKETSYVAAMPYSAADLMHGPIAVVEPAYPVLAFAPAGRTQAGMLETIAELGRRGADVSVVTQKGTAAPGATAVLELPNELPEPLSPLAAILPGQLLACHLALARGLDPDKPRGLNKVTQTF
jgi:glucosamine--fructose-6-phosphate aminotransferase (isomerizing)